MPALRMKATMRAIALALEETGVVEKAWPFPTETASPGDAVVGYPTEIEFDMTFGRGADTAVLPLWVVAGIWTEKSTLDTLDRLLGEGSRAVKDALETGEHGGLSDVISSLHAKTGGIDRMVLGSLDYAAARYDCEVIS